MSKTLTEKKVQVVGKSVKKIDGLSMATGRALYVDDVSMPGILYVKILTSPYAHALIKKIDISEAEKLAGVHLVLTHLNTPRVAHSTAGQGYPEPSPYDTFMFDKKVRFVGDRVAAVAAETLQTAESALKLIKVEYEVLPAVLDPEKAAERGAPVIHDEKEAKALIPTPYHPEKNLAAHVDVSVGDIEKGLSQADFVIENKYKTQYAQHCPIEPHVVITYLDENDRLVIRTSTQVPFHARRICAHVLQIPVKQIRVIKPRIGGGFGAKQEVFLEYICGAVTLRTRRPARLVYTREEEFVSSRTRHPQIIKMKTGIKKDGSITAIDMDVLMNTGAYGAHALTVLCNTGSKNLPLYPCNNVRFNGNSVYTNLPVGGAYRGYGVTQGAFALEVQADMMAEAVGTDPVEFRLKNHIKEGEGSPIFEALGEGTEGVKQTIGSCRLSECLKIGAKEIGWARRNQKNKNEGPVKMGIGVACLMQGSSIPEIDMGAATLKLNEDGSFNLLIGATDLGTGSDTVLAQIAAESLGVKTEDIIVYSSDTDFTPFDVGAYASSTTYLSGTAVQKAAELVKEQIFKVASDMSEGEKNFRLENSRVISSSGKSQTLSEVALHSLYSHNQFQIMATASHVTHKSPPPFAAHFVEVLVDTETGVVKVVKYVACVDCGTAINPKLAEGQTEGAVLNGISYALTEEFIFNEKGRVLNPNFEYYKIFNTLDLPEIKTILVPSYEPTGPYGAKSVSEISMNGALPAISNAIYNAVGIRLTESPFTPEKVLRALKDKLK